MLVPWLGQMVTFAPLMRSLGLLVLIFSGHFHLWSAQATALDIDLEAAPHHYSKRTPTDSFTALKADLESGRIPLDSSSEKAFVTTLLKSLEIPITSQLLVFSTTSLQLSLISPSNPRALYFNENIYVGYVPRGRIEVISIDPELGAIFYIFNIPRDTSPTRVERSERCMNCHAGEETQYVPALLIKSVVPGPTGGSLIGFRQNESGHAIPLYERFGGWYLTDKSLGTNHWANRIGRFASGEIVTSFVEPGLSFSSERYPVPTSDLLPHLLHEHQVGFVNRAIFANYQLRSMLHLSGGKLTTAQSAFLDEQAVSLTRYLLFANEAPLPPAVDLNSAFKTDFLLNRRKAADGTSLKDLDLQTRLFKHRCSYMIYSAAFEGLVLPLKQRIYSELKKALNQEQPPPEYAYLSHPEKEIITSILRQTLPDLTRFLEN